MAVRSLRSLVRMAAVRQEGTFSSSSPAVPGIVYGLRNALSRFAGSSRGIHSREAAQTTTAKTQAQWRLHILKDVITEHADGAFAAMTITVAAASVFAGVWYYTADHKSSVTLMGGQDDSAMNTDEYLRMRHSYNEAVDVVEEDTDMDDDDDDDDPAMRAKFEDWIKKYHRTYKDEEEKARRFRLFKAFAWSVDVYNAKAAQSGSTARYGLTKFADFNRQEMRRMYGEL